MILDYLSELIASILSIHIIPSVKISIETELASKRTKVTAIWEDEKIQ